jgi:hypothetical protein
MASAIFDGGNSGRGDASHYSNATTKGIEREKNNKLKKRKKKYKHQKKRSKKGMYHNSSDSSFSLSK